MIFNNFLQIVQAGGGQAFGAAVRQHFATGARKGICMVMKPGRPAQRRSALRVWGESTDMRRLLPDALRLRGICRTKPGYAAVGGGSTLLGKGRSGGIMKRQISSSLRGWLSVPSLGRCWIRTWILSLLAGIFCLWLLHKAEK